MFERLRNKDDKGFTLIELLVVMIIIGILAAIAIPIFLSQREKAQDTAARADVSTLGKEVNTYFVDSVNVTDLEIAIVDGRYEMDGGSLSEARDLGPASANNEITEQWYDSPTNWCIEITNDEGDVASGGVSFTAQSGLVDAACPEAPTP